MEKTFILRRAVQAVLPAALLLFSACSKTDTPAPTPAVDQGRIGFLHEAPSANVPLKFLFDDVEKATLTYGQTASYLALSTGIHTLRVVNSTGTTITTKQATVEKDKSYSYFAYAPTTTTVDGLLTTDDLTIPAASAGKARIRLVHLGQGLPTPLKLSTVVAGISDIAGTETQFAGYSGFVDILPGQYNVAVTSGSPSVVVANVADGSGSGMGTNKTYEAGKVYTVVLRGSTNPLFSADLQPKALLIQNN